jgi:hypothetical protein
MVLNKTKRFEFFCPVCCSRQRTNTIAKIGIHHHIAILSFTLMFTFAFWNFFGIKAITTYLVYWAIFEVSYRLRKRSEFVCRNCGFDPFLYKTDVEKTRAQVKNYLQDRILNEGHFQGKKLKNYRTQAVQGPKAASVEEANDEFGAAPVVRSNAEAHAEDVRDELDMVRCKNGARPSADLSI